MQAADRAAEARSSPRRSGRGAASADDPSTSRTAPTSRRNESVAVITPRATRSAGQVTATPTLSTRRTRSVVVEDAGDEEDDATSDGDEAASRADLTPQVKRKRNGVTSADTTPSSSASRTPSSLSFSGKSGSGKSRKRRRLGEDGSGDETLQPGVNMIRPSSSDAYFVAQAKSKSKSTTGSALVSHRLGPIDSAVIRKLSSNTTPSHSGPYSRPALIASTLRQARARFPGWSSALGTGFSIMVHGVGSKEHILEAYVREIVAEGHGAAAIVRGAGPDLKLEHILAAVEKAAGLKDLSKPDSKNYASSTINRVEARAKRLSDALIENNSRIIPRVFLVIHSMDASIFLTPTAIAVFEILAKTPGLCVIGSVEHANASMYVGGSATWLWYELHTFVPRIRDILRLRPGSKIAGLPSCLDPSGGSTKSGRANIVEDARSVDNLGPTASLATAVSVLKAVSANHRTFLCLLVREQLEAEKAVNGQESSVTPPVSVSSERALELARAHILGASAATLRSLLVEFITHNVVVRIASVEGLNEGSLRVHLQVEDLEEVLRQYGGEPAK